MRKIGKYSICGLLGRGGMGKVFKVRLPVIAKIAALKQLDPNPSLASLIGQDKAREIFISEAVIMGNLRHPNIVEIWDTDEADGKPFYTMDYYCNNLGSMIGESYRTEMPSRIIRLDKVVHYIGQTLSGLARLHHAGIVHRDIKPYNILITEYDIVKICDFGLSKLRGEKFSGPPNLKIGTPWYAAPEQEADPDQADARADLYSVGIMLYRMLTGALPSERPGRPSAVNPELDSEWDWFVKKAIAPSAKDRFASADEMLADLGTLFAEWKERKEKTCSLSPEPSVGAKVSEGAEIQHSLRSSRIKVAPGKAGEVFSTDALWQPLQYVQNDFSIRSDGTVADRATNLVWEKSGSRYPLTWEAAHAHIEKLNAAAFARRSRWRLPTVDELMSLLMPRSEEQDFCMESAFDSQQKWLWSCDRRSYMAAWYVNAEMGFVGWQDFSAYCYVRGVCRT